MQQDRLLKRANQLRNASTPFEIQLWRRLSRSQLGGYKFRRQHVIDNFIVDFFCPQKTLIVEIDGDTHDPERDLRRDHLNEYHGYSTIRFTNAEVGKNIDGVLEHLLATLEALPDRWPHSCPSPEGEEMMNL